MFKDNNETHHFQFARNPRRRFHNFRCRAAGHSFVGDGKDERGVTGAVAVLNLPGRGRNAADCS